MATIGTFAHREGNPCTLQYNQFKGAHNLVCTVDMITERDHITLHVRDVEHALALARQLLNSIAKTIGADVAVETAEFSPASESVDDFVTVSGEYTAYPQE